MPNDLMSQSDAADAIGVTRQAINNWIKRKGLPVYRARNGTVKVSLSEVRELYNPDNQPFGSD